MSHMSSREMAVSGYREALPFLLVSAAGGLVAGLILGNMDEDLATVRGLLVMIPAFLAIRGSVYGSLGARLSSALHQGLIEPVFAPDDRLVSAVVAALLNGVTASMFAAAVAYAFLRLLGRTVAPLRTLLLIGLLGAVLAGLALASLIIVVVFGGYRRGIDPDAVVGPTVTTAGDVFGMLSLYAATRIVLAL